MLTMIDLHASTRNAMPGQMHLVVELHLQFSSGAKGLRLVLRYGVPACLHVKPLCVQPPSHLSKIKTLSGT